MFSATRSIASNFLQRNGNLDIKTRFSGSDVRAERALNVTNVSEKTVANGDEDEEASSNQGRDVSLQWMIGVSGIVLAIALILVRPALPYQVDSGVGIALLLGTAGAAVWTLHHWWVRWRTGKRPRGMWLAAATTIVLALLLSAAAQPTAPSYHTAKCTYGLYGFGIGLVWVKVTPAPDRELHQQRHRLRVRWGPWEGRKSETLRGDVYFTFDKRDFYTRVPVDVSIEPPAEIVCGDGRLPPGARRVHLIGADWRRLEN
jgi:hypothetical protein